MWQLNLPAYNFRVKKQDNKSLIFDNQRKRYVTLTPEEWVRQHFLRYIIEEKGYPAALLAVEKQLNVNGLKLRCDAILYNYDAEPIAIIEFKAPNIPISQETFDQAAVYNSMLRVSYFIISNGLAHYCCKIDFVNSKYSFFQEIPDFKYLVTIK